MGESITVTGMVLSAAPIGDYDKRMVLLTKERGRISVFAKGARRQNSVLLAAATPFCFGEFTLYEGRSSYNIIHAEIRNYFSEISKDFEAVYYGFYFLEAADYYTRENSEESEMLRLLYATLLALLNPRLPNPLIRSIFEWKAMVLGGIYPQVFECVNCHKPQDLTALWLRRDGLVCLDCRSEASDAVSVSESAVYTFQYIAAAPIEKLYTFLVSQEVMAEMRSMLKQFYQKYVDKRFKALEILESIVT